jgi:hypothetical protein
LVTHPKHFLQRFLGASLNGVLSTGRFREGTGNFYPPDLQANSREILTARRADSFTERERVS